MDLIAVSGRALALVRVVPMDRSRGLPVAAVVGL